MVSIKFFFLVFFEFFWMIVKIRGNKFELTSFNTKDYVFAYQSLFYFDFDFFSFFLILHCICRSLKSVHRYRNIVTCFSFSSPISNTTLFSKIYFDVWHKIRLDNFSFEFKREVNKGWSQLKQKKNTKIEWNVSAVRKNYIDKIACLTSWHTTEKSTL